MLALTDSQKRLSHPDRITVAKALLIVVPLAAAIAAVWKFFIVAAVPFRLDYAEGFIFTNTLSILRGQSIYQHVESVPYIFGFYTPLYNYVGAFLFKITESSIVVLRGATFVFYLSTGLTIWYLVKKATGSVYAASLSALLFLSGFIVSQWSSIARPDMLGVLLIIIGIYIFTRREATPRVRYIWVPLIFALAFFTKQSFIFAPIAAFITLLCTNRKQALVFAASYAFFVGTGVAALSFFTEGEFFRQIFIYPSAVPYSNVHTAFRITVLTLISALPLVIIGLRRVVQKPRDFFSLYFISSFGTFLMLLRDGGIQNYLLEFVVALILASAVGMSRDTFQRLPSSQLFTGVILTIFFFSLWSFSALPWQTEDYVHERLAVFNEEISIIGEGTTALVEDPLVAYASKTAVVIDPYTYGQIAEAELLPTNAFFATIADGTYQYIDDYGAFDRVPGLMEVINDNFEIVAPLQFSKAVRPFDYSLYNRNVVTEIGTLYHFTYSQTGF